MVPAAALTQRLGGKFILSCCLGGSAIIYGALPAVARRYGAGGAQVLFTVFGLIQGGFSPALSALNSAWIPEDGYEKVSRDCPFADTPFPIPIETPT